MTAFARERCVEPADVLLAALGVVLFHYGNRERCEFAFTAGGPASARLIRNRTSHSTGFLELLEQVGGERRDPHAPGGDNPLASAPLVVRISATEGPDGDIGRLDCRPILEIRLSSISPECRVLYNGAYFDAPTVERFQAHYLNALAGGLSSPQAEIGSIPILTEAERRKILFEWNDCRAEYPRAKCLHQLFEERTAENPDAAAVVFEGRTMTYGELNARSNQLAHYLVELGVGPEVLVGVCAERSLEVPVALMGVLKAGGAYLALDPSYPEDRLAYMLQEGRVDLLVTQEKLLGRLPASELRAISLDGDRREIDKRQVGNPACRAKAENLAYVIYTSGSTGRPKGVMIDHRGAVNTLVDINRRFGVGPDDRVLALSSLCFDLSVYDVFGLLAAGGAIVFPPPSDSPDPEYWFELLRRERVTIWNTAPQLMELLASTMLPPSKPLDTALRLVLLSGDWIPVSLPERVKQFGKDVEFISLGGATEGSVWSVLYPVDRVDPDWTTIPYGRPMDNQEWYILDSRLNPVPIGVTGDLYIGGEGVSLGYLNRPDLTAKQFIPNPFKEARLEPAPTTCDPTEADPNLRPDRRANLGPLLYKTGDTGRYTSDGNIEFLGRIDHQVKIRGFRVELGEIEAVLCRTPGVRDAVVLAREDQPGDKRLAAYFIAEEGKSTTPVELRAGLEAKLPDYMVPYAFVCLPAFPLTANGKLDREALPSPDSRHSVSALEGGFEAPTTPLQQQLHDVWSEVLGIEKIGAHHNFFTIGGHSLLAVQVISRISRKLGISLPPHQLFAHPTIAELAACIEEEEEKSGAGISIRRREHSGSVPLAYDQNILWLFEQVTPGTPVYHIPLAFRLLGDVDLTALQRCLTEIVRRHEALRTTFHLEEGQPRQAFDPPFPVPLPITKIMDIKAADSEERISEWVLEQARRPFDLQQGPLFRAALLRLSPQEHILSVTMHHIAGDGWSLGVLIGEMNALYRDFSGGKPPSLPEPAVQYGDYVLWQRRAPAPAEESAAAYWQGKLRAPPPRISWPETRPSGSDKPYEGAKYTFRIDRALTARLHDFHKRLGTTLFTLLLAALKALLSRYTGRTDLLVGATVASRNLAETEPLIGFFINTLVLRSDLSGDPSFGELLERVRLVVKEAFDHQDLPLSKLLERISWRSESGGLLQVLFLMQSMDIPPLELSGVSVEQIDIDMKKANVDLTLELYDSEEGIRGWFEYRTDLFPRALIARLAQVFVDLLDEMVTNPQMRLSRLPAIESKETALPFRLSPMQQGFLYGSLRAPARAGVYVEQIVCRIREKLDERLLVESWQRVVNRYEVFRTGFSWENRPEPVQKVGLRVDLPVVVQDWCGLPEERREELLQRYLREDRRRGFDLTTAPLSRLALFRLDVNTSALAWSVHHILVDGRSMVVIVREVFNCYRSLSEGLPLSLPEFQTFRPYIEWLERQPVEPARNYWRKQLRGFLAATPIPLPAKTSTEVEADLRSDLQETMFSEILVAEVDQSTTGSLAALAREHGFTLGAVLQGAWALLLSRYSGEKDVLFGATKSVRHCPAAHGDSVGVYINTLALRVRVEPGRPLLDYLTELRAKWLEIRAYESTPISLVREWCDVPGNEPLFETYLMYEHRRLEAGLREQVVGTLDCDFALLERTPLPIMMAVYGGEELSLELEYDRRRFRKSDMRRMLGHFSRLLTSMAEAPGGSLRDLNMLTAEEIEAASALAAAPAPGAVPETGLVHVGIDETAAAAPSRTAVLQGATSLTYAELSEKAEAVAANLLSAGVGEGSIVALCLRRCPQLVAALLGVLKAGAAFLPIDPDFPRERLTFMLRDGGASLLITEEGLLQRLPKTGSRVLLIESLFENRTGQTPAAASPSPDSPAYLIYTSGSGGAPKGVMIEHRAFSRFVGNATRLYELSPDDRVLQFASLSFDTSIEEIFPCLLAGATLVLRTDEMLDSVKRFLALCEQWGLTVLDLPTAYWHLLTSELKPGQMPATVRLVIIGGEGAAPVALRRWHEAVGERVLLLNTYGPTESTVVATAIDLTREKPALDEVPIGKPLGGVTAYVLDADLQPMPPALPGELYLGGDQLARGYVNRPDATAESFVFVRNLGRSGAQPVDPAAAEAGPSLTRLYRTGDLVRRREDGQLVYIGRFDRQLKIRGYRVEPAEIENAIAGHRAVKAAAVSLFRRDADTRQLVAYVVPKTPRRWKRTVASIKAWLADRLPSYMQPVAYVQLERLPTTPSGKVDYRALPSPLAQDKERGSSKAPSDPLQEQLGEIWRSVLGVGGIGINDSFFDLGGNSLLAMTALSRMEKELGISLPPLRMFQAPTIAQLAEIIMGTRVRSQWRALEPIQARGSRPPLFFIGSDFYAKALSDHLGEDQPVYRLNNLAVQPADCENIELDLADIARLFVSEIRTVQARGPFFLAAFCLDAKTAYEMAQQLRSVNQRVADLTFVDALWTHEGLAARCGRHWRNVREFGPSYILRKIAKRLDLLRRKLSRILSPLGLSLYRRVGKEPPADLRNKLFIKAMFDAFVSYSAKPFDGKINLFVAKEWRMKESAEWGSLAAGGVDIIEVDGFHDTLFDPPAVAQLAAEIRRTMDISLDKVK